MRQRSASDRELALEAVARGESVASTGIPQATVRSWRRRDPVFAARFEAAQAQAARTAEEPLAPGEWEALLAAACRRGSTQALKLWADLHPRAPTLPPGEVDELAALRELRQSLAEAGG
jgi:hypothetical protein